MTSLLKLLSLLAITANLAALTLCFIVPDRPKCSPKILGGLAEFHGAQRQSGSPRHKFRRLFVTQLGIILRADWQVNSYRTEIV